MRKKKFTPISEIGEFNLIRKIIKGARLQHKSTKKGIGDDAAVLIQTKDRDQLISTDTLIEGVHFNPTYCPLKHIGYKAVAVNISDICSMNGTATHITVSLAIPNKYSVELVSELYEGIKLACSNYDIDLIGGDTTASASGLVISVTVLGESKPQKTTYRSGAKPGDLLVVSGDLGGAYLGLQILERENALFEENNKSQPKLNPYSHVLGKQLKPEPRTDIIKKLNNLSIQPSSMIDVSDGLSSESAHLARASQIGIKIFEDKIPISQEAKLVAEELNLEPTHCALYGGEDYELLFTVSIKNYKKLEGCAGLTIIGHTTKAPNQLELVTALNETINLNDSGWNPFSSQPEKEQNI